MKADQQASRFNRLLHRGLQAGFGWLGLKPSLSILLAMLTALTLLPPLILGAWLAYSAAAERRALDEQRLVELASTLALATDRTMTAWRKTAEMSAGSTSLPQKQFAAYHSRAQEAVAKAGGHLALVDKVGTVLLDTRVPYGTPIPPKSNIGVLEEIIAKAAPSVGFIVSDEVETTSIDVIVPVVFSNASYCLVYSAPQQDLANLLKDQVLPAGWEAVIFDGEGRVAVRSADSKALMRPRIPPDLQSRLVGQSGMIVTRDMAENPALAAVHRAPVHGWRAAVWAPYEVLDNPVRTLINVVISLVIATLLISTIVAMLTSIVIRRPVQLMVEAAGALARGEKVSTASTQMIETDVVRSALVDAAAAIDTRQRAFVESEGRVRHFTIATPALLWAASPDGRIEASERWYQYTGLDPNERKGGFRDQIHPEDIEVCAELWKRALADGTELHSQARIRGRDGSYRWFQTQAIPHRDEQNRIVGWYGSSTDIDDLKRYQQSLAASEERLRLAQDIAGIGTVEWDLATDVATWSDKLAELVGLHPDQAGRQSGSEAFNRVLSRMPTKDAQKLARFREQLVSDEREFADEFQLVDEDGKVRWLHLRGAILKNTQGGAKRLIGVARDISRRKFDELERARFVTVAEASREAIIGINLAGRIEVWNRSAEQLYGWAADDVKGRPADVLDFPDSKPGIGKLVAQVAAGMSFEPLDATHRHRAGRPIQVNVSVKPVRDRTGGVIAISISAHDIGERKRREAQTRFVMRELSHRSKNLLAVVQAMARQTARMSTDIDDFETRFSDRVASLARSHDLLVEEDWRGVMLGGLVASQLTPFVGREPKRIKISGPTVLLKPEAAQNIGMALHELATNASKYGALAGSTGRLHVIWQIRPATEAGGEFEIVWRESGGPPLTKPAHRGFGRDIIERLTAMALDGIATLDWTDDGVTWRLSAPVAKIVAQASEFEAKSADFDIGTTSRELKKFNRAWTELRGRDRFPRFVDFTASEIGEQDDLVVAIQVDGDPNALGFLMVGKNIAHHMGEAARDPQTTPLGRRLLLELQQCWPDVQATSSPCYKRIDDVDGRGRSYEMLAVPFSMDGNTITHLVGMVLECSA